MADAGNDSKDAAVGRITAAALAGGDPGLNPQLKAVLASARAVGVDESMIMRVLAMAAMLAPPRPDAAVAAAAAVMGEGAATEPQNGEPAGQHPPAAADAADGGDEGHQARISPADGAGRPATASNKMSVDLLVTPRQPQLARNFIFGYGSVMLAESRKSSGITSMAFMATLSPAFGKDAAHSTAARCGSRVLLLAHVYRSGGVGPFGTALAQLKASPPARAHSGLVLQKGHGIHRARDPEGRWRGGRCGGRGRALRGGRGAGHPGRAGGRI